MKDKLIEQLTETTGKIQALVALPELTEKETEALEALNRNASSLKARIAGLEQVEVEQKAQSARWEQEKQQAIAEAVKAEQAKARRPVDGESPYAAKFSDTWKYDTLGAGDLSLMIEILRSSGRPVANSAIKAMALRVGELKDDNTQAGRDAVNYVRNAFKASTGINPTMPEIENAFKAATDPMYTGGSGIGSDWVGTAYSSELWRAIRATSMIVDRIPEKVVPDGYSSMYVPLESTDPTWYKVAEATASDATLKVPAATITASQFATSNKQITLGKMGARVLYTQELNEDSLISFVPQLREQLTVSGAEILEHVVIDGDTETSASKNINDIASAIGGSEPYLLFNGFRQLPLITNTANARSAAGGFVIEDYIETMKLLGTAGIAGSDPSKIAFIEDPNVYYANMKLPEVKTRDVFGNAASVENGFVKRVYGIEIMPSWQMHRYASDRKANSAGKVDQDTTANNAYGAILAVRFDQWVKAFKRRMTMEVTRIANADSWEIVALVRFGLAYRDTEASAITYYVGV